MVCVMVEFAEFLFNSTPFINDVTMSVDQPRCAIIYLDTF